MPQLEFEVYCKCGYGMCKKTSVHNSTVTIEPCPSCMGEKDSEIKELKSEIESLEMNISKLEDKIIELENETK